MKTRYYSHKGCHAALGAARQYRNARGLPEAGSRLSPAVQVPAFPEAPSAAVMDISFPVRKSQKNR